MKHLKAAVVGTGFMGAMHTEALHRLGIEVVGILGSSAEKSRDASRRMAIPKGYATYEDLLAGEEVDVVHITTPNYLHYEQSKQALAAGKHVLCEKPLAMNTDETAELVTLAEQSGLVSGVNYNLRFYPLNIEARDMVERGDLGAVYSVAGSYVQDWLFDETDYNWRVLPDKGGKLRAIADIGTHWLDLVQVITGLKVKSVFADLHVVHRERQRPLGEVETFSGKLKKEEATEPIDIETEDGGAVLVRFENGVPGSLWVSQVTAGRKNAMKYEIAGSKKALFWNSEMPNELWNGYRDKANEWLHRDPSLLSEAARTYASYPGGHNEGYDDTFKQSFTAFYEYVAAGDMDAPRPFATFADGHEEVVLCEAVLESDEKERWVDVTL